VIFATDPLSPSAIATLLHFECDVVWRVLKSVRSLLTLSEDPNDPLRLFHKPFAEFITDPARCTDPRLYISPDYHAELVLRCFELMDKSLKKNVFSIPDYVLNSEVGDPSRRIKEGGIHGALEYACRSWHTHLVATMGRTADVVSALRRFLEQKFLFWLEVLSLFDAVDDAIRALDMTVKWLNEVCPGRQLDFQVTWC
jgi:hypothetical protein